MSKVFLFGKGGESRPLPFGIFPLPGASHQAKINWTRNIRRFSRRGHYSGTTYIIVMSAAS